MKKPIQILLFIVFIFVHSNSLFSNSIIKNLNNNSNYDSQHINEINDSTTVTKTQNNSIGNYKNVNVLSSSSKYLKEKSKVSLNVFPNPATEKLFVQLTGWVGEKEIKLIDITGRSVFILKSVKEINEIDISSFPKGIYIINVKNEFQRITKKIKIQ